MRYIIYLLGCDDSTIFDMELRETEVEVMELLAKKSQEVSTSICMPILKIAKAPKKESE